MLNLRFAALKPSAEQEPREAACEPIASFFRPFGGVPLLAQSLESEDAGSPVDQEKIEP